MTAWLVPSETAPAKGEGGGGVVGLAAAASMGMEPIGARVQEQLHLLHADGDNDDKV